MSKLHFAQLISTKDLISVMEGFFFYKSLRDILHDLRDVFAERITDDEIAKGSGAAIDVAAGVAFALRLFRPNSQISQLTLFPLKSIVNQDGFTQLLKKKNASDSDISSILESIIQLPTTVNNSF